MGLLCILISFTLVNVLVAHLDYYELEVLKTNEHIKLAKNYLPKIITELTDVSNKKFPYTSEGMAYMLVVPENVEEYDERSKRDISLYYQIVMQSQIKQASEIAAPDIDKAINYDDVTTLQLKNDRRKISGEAIINLIREVLDGKNKDFEDSLKLCRLIGLFRSLGDPNAVVIHSSIKDDTCILERMSGAGTIRYKRNQTKIWEVKKNSAFIAYLSKQINILKWDLLGKDYYGLEVLKTNYYFKLAKNYLPEIITEMVDVSNKNLPYSSEQMAYMLVVPENVEEYDEQSLIYQIGMQSEMKLASEFAAPDINETKNYNDLTNTMLKLGKERRKISGEVIITLIRGVLDEKNEDFEDFLKLCRLLGLFKSLQDPNAHVIHSSILNDTCILERKLSAGTIRYKRDEKNIWEVDDKDVYLVNLSEQIRKLTL